MKFNEYQKLARRTSSYQKTVITSQEELVRQSLPGLVAISMAAMGLAGEAGEVVDYLKKTLHHGHPLDREKVKKELGDVLWYVAETASALGLDLDDVATTNVDKLRKRYPEGFSSARSKHRAKGDE